MTAQRLEKGGRIDRNQPLNFQWDGQTYQGYAGDTLASALMANGQTVLGRSFKYHRPRGIMSAGVEESGAIVSVGNGARREPNVKATMQELYNGLEAQGQNAWPNVRFDLGAINEAFGRFFAAGFYYKTFMGLPPFEWGRGTSLWMQYEKLIRKAAGMGRASREPDPDAYDHVHAFCDILVVGSGPAGLSAALTAARAGRNVILVEQDFELGGDYLNYPDAEAERAALVLELQNTGVRILTRTTAFGLYDDLVAGLIERVTDHLFNPAPSLPRQRFWTLRSNAIILATGALERSIAFGNNDRPGIMTAAAGRAYLNRFGILPGRRVAISTNNDSAYGVAQDLAVAGAEVTLIDSRQSNLSAPLNVSLLTGHAPIDTQGRNAINKVRLAQKTGSGLKSADEIECDLLLISGDGHLL